MEYSKQKAKMIERLKAQGIKDPGVLRALTAVPREKFVPVAFMHKAYAEEALPIGFGQTISHPYTVARMTELLAVSNGMKVLEIGTGSGYQSAVLCELGVQLFTIEINRTLAGRAQKILQQQKYYCATKIGDGNLGWPAMAPYDAIIFTAGAGVIPERITGQLKEQGRLLIPLGTGQEKTLTLYLQVGKKLESLAREKFIFVELKQQQAD
jgi:protein-L-isoaspartate(D-aspartate) O-methyltransferase